MLLTDRVAALIAVGVSQAAGISAAALAAHAAGLPELPGAVLAIHPSVATASQLAPLLRLGDLSGFVVDDMTDVDDFTPISGVDVPELPLYLVQDPSRGDDLRNWSPTEALDAFRTRGRTPLTLSEGISWLLQEPDILQPGSCFMTIGSRKSNRSGLDSRTPAIWISGGTGRDGPARRNAPKVGWCWAGNRHTWLGHASASQRIG